MQGEYYFKEIEVTPKDIWGLIYAMMLVFMGLLIIVYPSFGFIVGLILMAVVVIKLLAMSKDYTQMFLQFILGMVIMMLSGYWIGEAFFGMVLVIIYGIQIWNYVKEEYL